MAKIIKSISFDADISNELDKIVNVSEYVNQLVKDSFNKITLKSIYEQKKKELEELENKMLNEFRIEKVQIDNNAKIQLENAQKIQTELERIKKEHFVLIERDKSLAEDFMNEVRLNKDLINDQAFLFNYVDKYRAKDLKVGSSYLKKYALEKLTIENNEVETIENETIVSDSIEKVEDETIVSKVE